MLLLEWLLTKIKNPFFTSLTALFFFFKQLQSNKPPMQKTDIQILLQNSKLRLTIKTWSANGWYELLSLLGGWKKHIFQLKWMYSSFWEQYRIHKNTKKYEVPPPPSKKRTQNAKSGTLRATLGQALLHLCTALLHDCRTKAPRDIYALNHQLQGLISRPFMRVDFPIAQSKGVLGRGRCKVNSLALDGWRLETLYSGGKFFFRDKNTAKTHEVHSCGFGGFRGGAIVQNLPLVPPAGETGTASSQQ